MYMRALIRSKPHSFVLRVVPTLDANGSPSFRLVDKIHGDDDRAS
jgi:hypothetical protein